MPAVEIVVRGDCVPFFHCGDAGADLHDLRGDLVADDDWKLRFVAACLDVLDREAGAAAQYTGDRFAGPGDGIGNLNELKRSIRRPEDECFHALRASRDCFVTAFLAMTRLIESLGIASSQCSSQ